MAAALFPACKPLDDDYVVASAGIRGLDGQGAHPLAVEEMCRRDVDISSHRARTVTPSLLADFDLILTMESVHKAWIDEKMPAVRGRVHLLGRWRGLEISDPVAGTGVDFARVADEIQQSLMDWMAHIYRGVEYVPDRHVNSITF